MPISPEASNLLQSTKVTDQHRGRGAVVYVRQNPGASRENVTVAGGVASRELLLSSGSPRTWWHADAAGCVMHVLPMIIWRPMSMLGIGTPSLATSARPARGELVPGTL
jgi:hypothetical protein